MPVGQRRGRHSTSQNKCGLQKPRPTTTRPPLSRACCSLLANQTPPMQNISSDKATLHRYPTRKWAYTTCRLSQVAATTGTFTTQRKAAVKSWCAWLAKAGIRNGENQHKNSTQAMWSTLPPALSTGTEPQPTAGLHIWQSRCQAPTQATSGSNLLTTSNTKPLSQSLPKTHDFC